MSKDYIAQGIKKKWVVLDAEGKYLEFGSCLLRPCLRVLHCTGLARSAGEEVVLRQLFFELRGLASGCLWLYWLVPNIGGRIAAATTSSLSLPGRNKRDGDVASTKAD